MFLIIVSIGCSTTIGDKSARGNRNLIIAEEIERFAGMMSTAYDAIRILRPTLLESSSRRDISLLNVQEDGIIIPIEDSVYLDGVYWGKLRSLDLIPVDLIGEIQYLRPSEAHYRYGFNDGGGVFKITSKQFKPQF